jgi:hypothetical protein
MFEFTGCFVANRRVRKIRVVIINPLIQSRLQIKRRLKVIRPDKVLFDRPHHPFSVGVAFGIIVACEDLSYPQHRTGGHKFNRGWLVAVVASHEKCLLGEMVCGSLGYIRKLRYRESWGEL